MHVALDAMFLDPGASGGPETVLRGLAPALRATRPDARVSVVTTRRGAAAVRKDGWEDVVALKADEGERLARLRAEQLALPRWCATHGVDVLHSIASMAPVRARVPHVVTVHDVTFMQMPTFGRITTLAMSQIIARAARAADGLTTGSSAALDTIAPVLGLPKERFTVIHHGIDRATPSAPDRSVLDALDLHGKRVVLCVATLRPHKNQEQLVRAAALLPDDVVVVLAGHREAPYDATLEQLADPSRVRIAGRIDDAGLEALWEAAAVAAFPTRAEGFGLPVAEALAHGVPVAVSDIPVLREVGGPFVRSFALDDPADCARAISECLEQPFDADGARERADSYTWRAAAEKYWRVYDRVAA